MLALMRRQLGRLGYIVDIVSTVEEAESAVAATRYDLVITDVALVRGTGELVARMVEEKRPGTPVLFMSGYVDLLLMSGARVLEKPYSSQKLRDAILDATREPAPEKEREPKATRKPKAEK